MQVNRFTKDIFLVWIQDNVYRHVLGVRQWIFKTMWLFSNALRKHCEKFGEEMIVRIKTEGKIEKRIKTSIFFSTASRKDAQNYGLP